MHTPASLVHNYPGSEEDAWKAFLDNLEALPPEYKVLGINDYLFVDGYERVVKEKQAGRLSNIDLILPVVELRLDKFGGSDTHLSRVNFHVIFSNELEPQVIREQFLAALPSRFCLAPQHAGVEQHWKGVLSRDSLTKLGAAIIDSVPEQEKSKFASPIRVGFDNLTLSLAKVIGVLEGSSQLAGRYVTAVGKTEWADVKWKAASIADKKHVINSADCVFIAAESASSYVKSRQSLYDAQVNAKLIDCSDAHCLSTSSDKDRIGNSLTWIKAETTFGGLLQALEEYDGRVFVGDIPPELERVRQYPSKYIRQVKVAKREEAADIDDWFNDSIPVNSGLVAIIGNKGSGKSALAEVIGLVCGSPHEKLFSFLERHRFRDPRLRLAQEFEAAVEWENGDKSKKLLSENVEQGAEARVQHLPQSYLESLCNEVPRGERTGFDDELERIIFSHIPRDRRLEATSLHALFELIGGRIQNSIGAKREVIAELNIEIARLETLLTPAQMKTALEAYRAARKEWMSFKRNPPAVIDEPPDDDPGRIATRDKIRSLSAAHQHLEGMLERTERDLAHIRRDLASLETLRADAQALVEVRAALIKEHAPLLKRIGVSHEFLDVKLDLAPLDSAQTRLSEKELALKTLLDGDQPSRGLREVMSDIDVSCSKLRADLSAPQEAREQYLRSFEIWKKRLAELRGTREPIDGEGALGLRRAYNSRLSHFPEKLKSAKEQRIEITRSIYMLLREQMAGWSALYAPLQAHMDRQALPAELRLSLSTTLVDRNLSEVLLEQFINRNAAGSFAGISESQTRLANLMDTVDFDDADSIINLVQELERHLHFDVRRGTPAPVVATDQLRNGQSISALYDFIFGLEFLSLRYALRFGQKPVYQLSPGEKGTLLLIFFLLAEVDTRPLIVDQPEDNLDNNTVYRALVHCFKEAKRRRQVLIITHNPNLAVVCDADQIIVAEMDKAKKEIRYRAGALESADIAQSVIDILEGTRPAFNNRSIKYALHLR